MVGQAGEQAAQHRANILRRVSTALPPTIAPAAAARWQRVHLPQSPWLHEEVARRMEERLDWIKLQPTAWLDWQPLNGGLDAHQRLVQRYPKARRFVTESHPQRAAVVAQALHTPWWTSRRWRQSAPEFRLPEDGQTNMVWANMALHMSADPAALIAQWQRLLATDGFLMLSCLGPDSLRELRAVYAAMGWAPPCHEFTDMHDWGDMLVHAGFAEPVMDMERITLTYTRPEPLLDDLRSLGRNLHTGRAALTRGRGWRERLLAAIHQHMPRAAGPDGVAPPLALTFEVIYGHALKPAPRSPRGEQRVPLTDMRAMLKRPVE